MATDNLTTLLAGLPAMVFPFWPVILIGTLFAWGFQDLRPLVVVWVALMLIWLLARGVGAAPLFPLIPEPLSSTLFFLIGAGLILFHVFRGDQA
ncbi:MAG TPA: hypothetical protein VF784_03230 [Anaerolineales bacterium]